MGNGGGADMRSHWVFLAAAVGLALFGCGCVESAHAQAPDYPSGKITFIVGFAPGGGIDTYARVIAQGLGERLGWSVVIENRPGAASNIAARAVAAAPPDGYTILFTGNSYAINQTFYKNPGYATADLRPVAFVAIDSQGLAVNAANPARTLPEFLRAAKAKPFTFAYGGSSARIVAEYVFQVLAKANATGVPFQSGAPALNALLGNHVDILAAPVAELHPQVQQGAARVLAVTGPRRGRGAARYRDPGRARPARPRHQWLGRHARTRPDPGRDRRPPEWRGEQGHCHAGDRAAPAQPRLRTLYGRLRRRSGLPQAADRHLGQPDSRHRHYRRIGPKSVGRRAAPHIRLIRTR
jgi:tripartite-type tricarboxylate transporter receptor subunit TctC